MRYALYFTPSVTSPWHGAGADWLGRDAVSGEARTQPRIPGVPSEVQRRLTANARRYGFHATLKAPFRLAGGASPEQLLDMTSAFCATQKAIVLRTPHVARHRDFLALLTDDTTGEVAELAMRCVRHVDTLRASLTADELARRRRDRLTPRQETLLQRWGYPYTEEQFRFHMTLSGALSAIDEEIAARVQHAACEHFSAAAATPLVIEGVSIMCQASPDAPFLLWQRCGFARAAVDSATVCGLHYG